MSDTEKISESVKLFEKSLKDSNVYIRQAAAEELAFLISIGTEISAKTKKRVKMELSGWWAGALEAVEFSDNTKALEFLLAFDQNAPVTARDYVISKCADREFFFDEKEQGAVEGHFAVLNLRYNEALSFFRNFQEDGAWSENIPSIFLDYPELIVDLGRAFQYTSSGLEGLSLFLQWENNLTETDENASLNAQYRLLFYAARIARRNGRRTQSVSLFEQALPLAPDAEQSQACIWYILDLALSENSQIFIQQLEKFIPHWGNGNYFNDVLENFLQTLVSRRNWENIIQVFNLIKNTNASAKAAYAWVIARSIEEGLLSNGEKSLIANFAVTAPFYFMQIAYAGTKNDVGSFLYYRSIASDVLCKPLLEMPEQSAVDENLSPVSQFLLGFFIYNVPEYAMSYINRFEDELTAPELRLVAAALQDKGMYIQSIQFVLRYIERKGHILDRTDMELLFPRPYMELVEMYAEETGIAPQILYGLIRTESAFQNAVISSAGAAGLTQLMPDTAMDMAGRIRRAGGPDYVSEENGLDLSDPAQNIHIGAYYLKYLLDRFDDVLLSLLAYNGGMNRIRRLRAASPLPVDLFLETISIRETRDYGRKVLAAAAVYEALYYAGEN